MSINSLKIKLIKMLKYHKISIKVYLKNLKRKNNYLMNMTKTQIN